MAAAFMAAALALAGCEGKRDADAARDAGGRDPTVTISGEEAIVVPAWQPAPVEIAIGDEPKVLAEAEAALDAGHLFGQPRDAVPLLLELHARMPEDPAVRRAHARALAMLLAEGEAALARMDEDAQALRRAHEIGEVGRTAAAEHPQAVSYTHLTLPTILLV